MSTLDLTKFKVSQEFSSIAVKKQLLTVPVKKPSKENWIQVHPDESYTMVLHVLELKEARETYIVDNELMFELAGEQTICPKRIFTGVTSTNVCFLWPIREAGADGRLDDWNQSAMQAAEMAKTQWVRVQANMSLGAYDVQAAVFAKEPKFPEVPFSELVNIAFKNKIITSINHPVLRQLRGEE